MNQTTEINRVSGHNVAESITIALVIMILYALGLWLHIRIIKISKKTKDMTWKVDISHSILCIVLYTYNVLIHSTTYFVEDLYLYTGEWFCYAAKVVSQFSALYLGAHSTIIAAMKYIVIVHDDKVRKFKSKIKDGFVVLNCTYPIMSIAITLLLIPNYFVLYGGHSHVNRCFGNQNRNYKPMFSICDLIEPRQIYSVEGLFHIMKWIICKAQIVLGYMAFLNIFDLFFYYQTFSFMRK